PVSVGGCWVALSSTNSPQKLQSWFWSNTTWIPSPKLPNSRRKSRQLKELYRQ
ncbi:hypothetical protein PHYSODRAFT_406853, partial [Phytophthora sojae]